MSVSAEDVLENAPHMRVLVCRTCTSLDEIPDWEGSPDTDPFLKPVADKHGAHHEGQLFRLPIGLWLMEDTKKKIIEQVRGGGTGLAAIDPAFYDTRNQFQEDAMACFSLHLRPKGQCPDFRSERKQLNPDTKADRKAAGLRNEPSGPKVYLCDFCPVRSYNEQKHFDQFKI